MGKGHIKVSRRDGGRKRLTLHGNKQRSKSKVRLQRLSDTGMREQGGQGRKGNGKTRKDAGGGGERNLTKIQGRP